jgi:hypothetical protein
MLRNCLYDELFLRFQLSSEYNNIGEKCLTHAQIASGEFPDHTYLRMEGQNMCAPPIMHTFHESDFMFDESD